ncbi:MAG TPA: superinfection immunity protein [Candidatus Binataceae bacterium]|nr:superinfection immunity protein [Candidatus Binataceae bacterium]
MFALVIGGGIFVYFLPSLLAVWRRVPEKRQICALNLYLGWTVIAWTTALQWALHLRSNRPSSREFLRPGSWSALRRRFSRSRWFWTGGLLAVSAVFIYLSLFVWPATPRLVPTDQFINFDDARRMAGGEKLYADIFQYTTPGTELLELGLIKLFGVRIVLLNVLMMVVGLVDAWLAMLLASSVLEDWDAALVALLFLCFGFHCSLGATHHPFSVMFVYAAAAAIIRRRDPLRLATAGTLLGLATAFTQTRGLAVIAIAGFVAWENGTRPAANRRLWRDELSLLAPFAAIVGAACVYVIWNAGVDRFIRYIVEFPLLYYRQGASNTWATSFAIYIPTLRGFAQWALIKLLVPAAYLVFAVYWWRRPKTFLSPRLLLLTVVGVSLFATVAYAPLHQRLAEVSLPAFILAVWMANRVGDWWWKIPAWGAAVAFVTLAPITIQRSHYWYFDSSAGRIATSRPEAIEEYAWLRDHTKPGDYFFADNSPRLYVLLGLHNPSRLPFVEPNDYTRPTQVASMVRRLTMTKPRFVLWGVNPTDFDDPGDRLFPVGELLRHCYHPVRPLLDGVIWQRDAQGCVDQGLPIAAQ